MDSTSQYEYKAVVIYVATSPPSSKEGNRSDPFKASGFFLKSYYPQYPDNTPCLELIF